MDGYGNPGGNPGNSGPSGDYFDGGNMAAPDDKSEGEHTEPHDTGILPKALMAGKDFKVGEEIVLKITAVHENDFEVEYAYGDEKEGKEEGGEPPMETAAAGGGGGEEMMY